MKRDTKKTRPDAGTSRRAGEAGPFSGDTTSNNNSITALGAIASLLLPGAENGQTRRDLVRLTGLTEREVRRTIQLERLAGAPILSDCKNGYYLPEDDMELAACVRSLRHRAGEILRAADAIEGGETVG